jgi:quinol monooxygenase YgiN
VQCSSTRRRSESDFSRSPACREGTARAGARPGDCRGRQSGYNDRKDARPGNRARRSHQATQKSGGGTVSELLGIARFKFHEGKLEEYKRLSAQAMEIVRTKDTGTLQYDIYFNDDQSECMVVERYRDSEALIEHMANLGDLGGQSSRRSPWFTARSSVSRAQSSERIWPTARSSSSRPTSRCRHRSPAWARLLRPQSVAVMKVHPPWRERRPSSRPVNISIRGQRSLRVHPEEERQRSHALRRVTVISLSSTGA